MIANSRPVTIPYALKLVKDTVILVQIAEFAPQVIVDIDRFDRSWLHIDIPYFERKVVSWEYVPTIMTELDVWYRRDDFGEEGPIRRVFLFLIF